MSESDGPNGSSIIPAIRYTDAATAIDWLCDAFGFARHLVVPGEEGTVVHAQLTLGRGMVMLGQARDDVYGATQKSPAEVGGYNTQSPYVVVGDLDAHHARAVAAGAEIVMPLEDQGYGKMYSCRDPEGHLWTFGDYDPWAPAPEA